MECDTCHIPVPLRSLNNSTVLHECQQRILTFSVIAPVRKRSFPNTLFQNKRSNLTLNLIPLITKNLRVKNAVAEVSNQNLIAISIQKKRSFFLSEKEDQSRSLTEPNLTARCPLSVQYFLVS